MRLESISLSTWAASLPDGVGEVFHTPAALGVIADHTAGDLELVGGYNGDRLVALFPASVRRRSVGTMVLSPPPSLGIPRLGPLLFPQSPKVRKREQLNRAFTEGLLEYYDVDRARTLFRTVCPMTYDDPRPFTWADQSVSTAFTYHLETTGRTSADIMAGFSQSLRREIRDATALSLTVDRESLDAVRPIYEETATRYREQGREYPLAWPYVSALTEALAAVDRCRVYVARDAAGEFLGGIVALYSDTDAYFWLGGARTTYDGVTINSLVHWRIIEDLIDDPPRPTTTRYDLMGANTERLCRYKSKFGATLVPYYIVESSGQPMELAKRAYQLVRS